MKLHNKYDIIYEIKKRNGKSKLMEKNIINKIEKVKQKLKEEGYEGKLISYKELQELHKRFIPEIEEKVFAVEVLGLTEGNYNNMKNKGTKGRILKKKVEIDEEKVEKIKKILKEEGYEGKLISYEELQELHKRFMPEVEEKVFAIEVLGLTESSYNSIKYKGTKGRILKKKVEIDEEKVEKIKKILKEEGYEGKLISYEELQELHKRFMPEVEEKVFAIEVLGLTESSYNSIKYKGTKGRILKKKVEIDEEKVEKIKKILKEEGYEGKLISYEELQELHKRFMPEVEEKVFAIEVLGLTYSNYYSMKNTGTKGRVKDKTTTIKAEYIKQHNLEQSRYYAKEEINKICEINNITIDEFIKYIIINFKAKNLLELTQVYKETLEVKGRIWIGRTELSKEYTNKNIEKLYEIAKIILYKHRKIYKYNKSNEEDYIQELVIYAIQICGDIEKNFGEEEEKFNRAIYNRMKYHLINLLIRDNKLETRTKGLTKRYSKNDEEYEYLSDESEKVDEKVEDMEIGERCIERLKELVKEGTGKKEALAIVAEEFKLSKQELITIMSMYIESGKGIPTKETDGYGYDD